MNREKILRTLREHKIDLQKKYPLKSIALFGSYARGEENPESDIDVMVEFSEPVGFEFIDLLEELEKKFQEKKVDLISREGIKPHYRPYIEEDAIYV